MPKKNPDAKFDFTIASQNNCWNLCTPTDRETKISQEVSQENYLKVRKITEENRDSLGKAFDELTADCDSKGFGFDACMNIRGDFLHISECLSNILYYVEHKESLDDI